MEVIGLTSVWPEHDETAEEVALQQIHPLAWNLIRTGRQVEDMLPAMRFRAQFGTDRVEMPLVLEKRRLDTKGFPIAIYKPYYEENTPQHVRAYQTLVFRNVPTGQLAVQCDFEVQCELFQAKAITVAGTSLGRYAYLLEKGQEIAMEELRAQVCEDAAAQGLLASKNQPLRLLLAGAPCELPQEGTLWKHEASVKGPYFRLRGKTNLPQLRLDRRMQRLQEGRLPFDADFVRLA